MGQKQPEQCGVVYSRYVLVPVAFWSGRKTASFLLSRCSFAAKDIMSLMRQRGTSLDIKTNEEYGCTVLFLWNKKLNIPKKDQDGDDEGDYES